MVHAPMLWAEAIGLAHGRSTIMNAPHPTVSPLRQRMVEDVRMRRLGHKKLETTAMTVA
jgi:hypothetical protein